SRRSFAKRLFLEKYRYYYQKKDLLYLLSNEIDPLKNLDLIRDVRVVERFVDSAQSAMDHIYLYFEERIELEKDEKNWTALNLIIDLLKSIKHPKVKYQIKKIINFVFSKEFYERIFNEHYIYKKYEKVEEYLPSINHLSNQVQKNYLIEIILKDIKKYILEPFNEFNFDKLIKNILYHRFYTKRILEIIEWEGLPEFLLKMKKNIDKKFQISNHFRSALKHVLSSQDLNVLISNSPSKFIEILSLWQKRARGEKQFDFFQIGDFPTSLELELDVKKLFED
ncbi:unnamed protein product, partial [marine sediment metagenome]